jgi:hypothetical protein
VQTEVAEKVAAKLGGDLTMGQIARAEIQRAKRLRPSDLTAYAYFQIRSGPAFPAHNVRCAEHSRAKGAEKLVSLCFSGASWQPRNHL